MKKITNVLLIMSCLLLSTFMLIGCGKDGEVVINVSEPVHAVLILQPISTAPMVNVEAARDLLETVCSVSGSSVSIIVADGEPWEYASVAPDGIDTSLSADMQEQIIEERVQKLIAVATSAESSNPETDLRKAVEMGARELHSYNDGVDLEMIICGSFINTVAPIPMQDMVLSYMDVDSAIHELAAEGYVVDLHNISITGYNLGDTCGEQKDLSNKDRESLEMFWSSYFEAGEAKAVHFMKDLPSELSYEGLPEVSTIPVVENGSALQELAVEDMAAVDAVSFDETAIAFHPGNAELMDEDAAREAVASVAEYMRDGDVSALLVGGTAHWGDMGDSITLSYERGHVLKQLFVDAGVDARNLTVVGTGWLSCFYVNDLTEDGELDENFAPQNRACTWVKADSKLARQVLDDEDYSSFIVD